MVRILAVIPARYASERLPGKVLLPIAGRPMLQWVYEATIASNVFDQVAIATEDQRVVDAAAAFGAEAILTSADLASGTDRVAEASLHFPDCEVIANVQGDQPFVTPGLLQALVSPYRAGELPEMTTVGGPYDPAQDADDPNTVKVVCDQRGNALYFSRSAIPYPRTVVHDLPVYHHFGLYAFRRDFLAQYRQLPPTPLERSESLEQLRVLEQGYRIRVVPCADKVIEVNTADDLERANAWASQR
ncbi:3-deoxy-manno-octulosonate cytidylyltransferase [Synechococcus elongatus]|uniref:3-deoxy-manno-octulosonate cytidylyltransferase n=1 Tax=Synechococcus elongatus TaxID=32046 RepID=UPI000F7EDB58|nr:3-deoxy-manno-octulosonate cytidylyltransferase [Synechococcus elongatus]